MLHAWIIYYIPFKSPWSNFPQIFWESGGSDLELLAFVVWLPSTISRCILIFAFMPYEAFSSALLFFFFLSFKTPRSFLALVPGNIYRERLNFNWYLGKFFLSKDCYAKLHLIKNLQSFWRPENLKVSFLGWIILSSTSLSVDLIMTTCNPRPK